MRTPSRDRPSDVHAVASSASVVDGVVVVVLLTSDLAPGVPVHPATEPRSAADVVAAMAAAAPRRNSRRSRLSGPVVRPGTGLTGR
jgi:hypothetical protein